MCLSFPERIKKKQLIRKKNGGCRSWSSIAYRTSPSLSYSSSIRDITPLLLVGHDLHTRNIFFSMPSFCGWDFFLGGRERISEWIRGIENSFFKKTKTCQFTISDCYRTNIWPQTFPPKLNIISILNYTKNIFSNIIKLNLI